MRPLRRIRAARRRMTVLVLVLGSIVVLVALAVVLVAHRQGASLLLRTVAVGPPASDMALAVDERTGRAFVTNSNSNTVSVLDAATGRLLRTVGIEYGPNALAVDVRAGRVFVLNADTGVSVLDARGGRLLHTASVDAQPVAMAVDARAGRVFVAKVIHGVAVLDVRSGAVLRTVPVGVLAASTDEGTTSMVVDERAGRVFITSSTTSNSTTSNNVVMLDAVSGRVQRTIPISGYLGLMAMDERTGRAFIPVGNGNGIGILDTHSGVLLRTIHARAAVLGGAPTVDVATNRVFVTISNGVLVLDARSGRIVHTTALGIQSAVMIVDAPVGRVLVLGTNGVGVLDARSGTLLHYSAAGLNVPFWNPDAVAVDERTGRLFVISDLTANIANKGIPTGPGYVSVLDGRSGAVLQTAPVGVAPSAIAVDSRAGRVLVLNSGGPVAVPDPWGWVPSWLRGLLPFVPHAANRTRTEPASVSILNARG